MIHRDSTNVMTGVLAISRKSPLAGPDMGFERVRFYAFAARTACAICVYLKIGNVLGILQ